MRRRKTEEKKENRERWLITYADLITLLMIFFIMLYTMAKVDTKKFAAISQSLKEAIGAGQVQKIDIVQLNSGTSAVLLNPTGALPENKGGDAILQDPKLKEAKKNLDKQLEGLVQQNNAQVITDERGIVIRVASKSLFSSGSADVLQDAQRELLKIAAILEPLENQIRVEGFTDSQPINSPKYPSNWELSGARAFNVLKFIISNSKIPPDRIAAVGYGEYRPVNKDNKSSDRPEDRRVDIVVLENGK